MASHPAPRSPNALTNGHQPSIVTHVTNGVAPPSHSESELSDAGDVALAENTSSRTESQGQTGDNDVQDLGTPPSSQDEDAEGEEDADYDVESPPPAVSDTPQVDESSSSESQRPSKRKASVEGDDYMLQNPELYGLRRSGRARPNRRVVESSDEEDSGSDAVGGHNRKKRKTTAPTRTSQRPTPALPSSTGSDSDSEGYVGARRNAPTKKQKRRQLQVAAGLAPPSQAEVRFSTRRAAKVANYNEDDGDSFEEDEAYATPNYASYAVDDTTPAIDIVLHHRPKDTYTDEEVEPTKHDLEFLIKWQDRAHYHATWETWENLTSYRGFRRLENYFRKIALRDWQMRHSPEVPPEEKEKWILDRETIADSVLENQQIERVIGTRDGDEGTEYYVKWKGLFYDSCTWEAEPLVSELAQTEIDRYLDRSSKLPTSNAKESILATRSKYTNFKTQPSYIKHGDLREFQIQGVNFLAYHWCRGENVILADEMGLGKTVQTVSFLNWLRHDRGQQGPFLVVVPLSTMPAWAETFNNWTPDLNYVVYNGKGEARKIIQEYELLVDDNPKKIRFNALLTTYEYILSDYSWLSRLKWQFLAVDEAHRLKNRDSQLYGRLLDFNASSRLLITGTPMQNTLGELSALMDFLMPGKINVDEEIDLQSESASQKIAELTNAIKPYMIRRTKQRVENDLPSKTEKIIRVELSDVQLEYYKNILTRNYAALNQGSQKTSLLNIMMELKKASNHPYMFPNAEERLIGEDASRSDQLKSMITSSGKMMLLDQLLLKLKKDNHRVLIFSQMVKMLDILSDYLKLRGYQFQRLDGTIAAGPRRMAIDHFNAPGSNDFCFLLSTRAGGLGINLMTADTVILFDSDWNPQADLQAMARAHRIGQKNPVTIYRLVSKDTVEEEVLERARNKLMLEFITIQRGVTDTDKELSDRVARAGRSVAEPNSAEDISRILKRRGQKMFEQSGNQKRLEELDIDAVLENAEEHKTEQPEGITADGGEEFLKSFEYTDVKLDLEWDDIIPKDQLDAIKAEEKRKDDEKYLAAVIEQNAPRKRKAAGDDEREQRAAKKRARDLAAEHAADVTGSDDDSGPDNDPKRPMSEKEIRNLIRAHEKYGSIEERGEEMIKDAKLVGRDLDLLKATIGEVITHSQKLLKEDQERMEAMVKESNKALTKKDKKAVLFDWKGVKRLNAETIVERTMEMKMLKEVTEATPDWRNFRIPEASKPAHYSCPWGAREDGMLCVGISKHGYGAWTAIRDDPELGMTDKFFLEEHRVDKKEERSKAEEKNAKSPGAVHLVRRANYLLSVLKDKTSNGTNIAAKRALENHHRNNKKWANPHRRSEKSGSVSASPAPNTIRRVHEHDKIRNRSSSHSEHRHSVDRRVQAHGSPELSRKPSADGEAKHSHAQHHRSNSNITVSSPMDDHLARVFKPVRASLEEVSRASKARIPDQKQRLTVLKKCMITIGNYIKSRLREGSSISEDQYWDYISKHWPKKGTPGSQLKTMYDILMAKEGVKVDKNEGANVNGQSSSAASKVGA
ncbi:chromodomain helicase-like protein [Patellaria atrata CBS 101060]|uniref:Chromodomain helicase-like protein n=1 Tax=Patellaria atrata CBS 101060 TaxID=1346257 RepID=A0A9P4SH53_9PEZI|nr:chromodomain helicase-like protein [Patellaria atrata CBS 101060]